MQWKEEIDGKVLLPNGKPLPVVLLGNKCDLDEAEIDKSQLDKFCNQKGFAGWFDTSAKLNINIEKAARFLVERILEHQDIFQKKKVAQVSPRREAEAYCTLLRISFTCQFHHFFRVPFSPEWGVKGLRAPVAADKLCYFSQYCVAVGLGQNRLANCFVIIIRTVWDIHNSQLDCKNCVVLAKIHQPLVH